MNWDDYKLGSQWVIEELESGTSKHDIFRELDEGVSMGLEDWVRGAYAILIDRSIVSPLGKSEAAKQTGYTRNAIQKAIENGYLKATLVDGHYNIHPLDLESWQNSDKKRKPYKKIEKP